MLARSVLTEPGRDPPETQRNAQHHGDRGNAEQEEAPQLKGGPSIAYAISQKPIHKMDTNALSLRSPDISSPEDRPSAPSLNELPQRLCSPLSLGQFALPTS